MVPEEMTEKRKNWLESWWVSQVTDKIIFIQIQYQLCFILTLSFYDSGWKAEEREKEKAEKSNDRRKMGERKKGCIFKKCVKWIVLIYSTKN